MGKVVERKKRKKGRPSLLDLQKRNLKEQQEQEDEEQKRQNHNKPKRIDRSSAIPNPNYASSTPLRRSTRRNPNPDGLSPDDHDDAEYNQELARNRRERKLKLVLRLHSQKPPVNSSSLNSGGSDSNAEGDDNVASANKKRKIGSIAEGSRIQDSEKGEKSISTTNPSETLQGSHMDSGPSTLLPDKKLLLFILDRLQKKDIYGVFSEPVDPNELPDYHEIIEHPMDFGTVRGKLTSGAYTSLEQFEKDILLISSNAMQYNAPDTIYFRQARTIQELAKKNFKNLRQDSDENEPEPKVARRGRPPTKHLKKPLGRPSLERAGSEFSPDATLATGGENTNRSNDLRKGFHHFEKTSLADFSGRFSFSSNSDAAAFNLFNQSRIDRSEDITGSGLRINSVRQGKRPIVSDENRRNTYKQFQAAAALLEPSVLNTFDRERKLLMPVGLFLEHAYARSLARFAADLGSVAWRVASKKIERSLPAGSGFGPGWVVENDTTPKRVFLPQAELCQMSTLQPYAADVKPLAPEQKGVRSSDNSEADTSSKTHDDEPSHAPSSDGHLSRPPTEFAATSSSPSSTQRSSEPCRGQAEAVGGLNPSSDYNVFESSIPTSRPSFQKQRATPTIRPGMNGFNGTYAFDLSAHRGKLTGASEPAGEQPQSSRTLETTTSRTNANFIHPATDPSTTNSSSSLLGAGNEAHSQGPSPAEKTTTIHHKPESVPPDVNARFKSPGSPSCSKVECGNPDLVLQL
ncbi:Bromodomain-containing protein 1 [Cucurbita argyrosperma subsp. argyrosperma]|nr:Bromodomain-containing protein 1 [Cucurbita argyrosperma subsp. argyrosperma]